LGRGKRMLDAKGVPPMLDRLGAMGILASLVFVAALGVAVFGGRPIVGGILAAAAGIFVLTRLFRSSDA
jgi:hypothetical protein